MSVLHGAAVPPAPHADAPVARDPGLQPERTALAWYRTLLAMALNGGLVLRAGLIQPHRGLQITGIVLLVLSGLIALAARRRTRSFDQARPAAPPDRLMLAIALATASTAAGGLWALLA